jgi:23S rRNA (adenine2503-C2)-methyltransferase
VKALSEYTLAEFERQLTEWGFKPSHAQRLLRAYYDQGGTLEHRGWKLPHSLQERLSALPSGMSSTLAARQVATDGTTKLLVRLTDGKTVEAVVMPDWRADRAAGCLSSQVGCAMGCDFCATAQSGFERNLTAGEMGGVSPFAPRSAGGRPAIADACVHGHGRADVESG